MWCCSSQTAQETITFEDCVCDMLLKGKVVVQGHSEQFDFSDRFDAVTIEHKLKVCRKGLPGGFENNKLRLICVDDKVV